MKNMKCRVCGNEIGKEIYCPMCGAAADPKKGKEEIQEQTQEEYSYQYQGVDTDATTVLSVNKIENKKDENKENSKEEKCVVTGEVEIPKKSHKKLIIILSIIAAVLMVTGIVVFCYFRYIYPNKITYKEKTLYYAGAGMLGNSDDVEEKVPDTSDGSYALLQSEYENSKFLYMGTDGRTLELTGKKKSKKASEDKQIVSVVADESLNKVYYWTQEEENSYSLHCLGADDVVKRYVTGVNGTVISSEGDYLAYSYQADEENYVICEVMPSGEVNQIATTENPVRVIGVTDKGKVFCQQQNQKNQSSEDGEEVKLTYNIYCVQDKKSYGTEYAAITYFGYYKNLDAFVVQTEDKAVYFVDTTEEGKERLVATNVDWFTDASEPTKYEQSCDREVILGSNMVKTYENTSPCYYYLKENSLYSYNILEGKESCKVAANFGRAQKIQLWNQNLLFYLAGENLYSCEKIEKDWQEPKLLAKKCTAYQYAPGKNCVYYLADGTLYSYADGKEEKISGGVKSFDLNAEEKTLAYNTDTSVIVREKDEEEYAIKSQGQVFVIGKDVYYTDAKNTLYCLENETQETKKVAKQIEKIKYIWK